MNVLAYEGAAISYLNSKAYLILKVQILAEIDFSVLHFFHPSLYEHFTFQQG